MTTATAPLFPMEAFDSSSTDVVQHEDSANKFIPRISGSRDTIAQSFSETLERYSNVTGLLPRKAIDEEDEPEVPISLVFPEIRKPEYQSVVLQDWEGVIETVDNESFAARLRDLTINERYPSEMVEIPIEDVSEDDLELLRVGAVFYLTVGRLKHRNGRQERFGRIVFRRLPSWTSSAVRRAKERAERFANFLGSED